MRILVAEDEHDLNNIIVRKLKSVGYSVDACENGADALDYLRCGEYDAVVMDIMMPRLDGVSVVHRLRNAGDTTPVLFLTARDSIDDRVAGLDAGADDYLVKPFAMAELLARLRVLTRRSIGAPTNVFTAADLTVDCSARTVIRGGKKIELSAKEFALLEYLIRNKGIVLSREKIESHIWNFDYAGGSNVVDVYIRYLRRKVDDGFALPLIRTVRGIGYVLREDPA